MSKTHLHLMVLQPLGRSVSLKTLHQWSASSSSLQAVFHSFCTAFGKCIRSLYCHSLTLETLGIFSLASVYETAALGRKLMRSAPPSCAILTRSADLDGPAKGWLLPLPPPLGPGLWLPCDGPWNGFSSLSAKNVYRRPISINIVRSKNWLSDSP